MSVGNTNVPEWNELVTYCKNNKIETAHFFLDLIDAYELQHKKGIRADNFVGFFNNIIEICFSDDQQFPKFKGFVGGYFCQNKYVDYIKKYLSRQNNQTRNNMVRVITSDNTTVSSTL